MSLVTQPKALGFGRKPHSWNVPAPPTNVPEEKQAMWAAGSALNLTVDDFARLMGQQPGTIRAWCAASGSNRARAGWGYVPTGHPLGLARAIVEAAERVPDLGARVLQALDQDGPIRAVYEVLHARFGDQVPEDGYQPHPDPHARTKKRREATTAKRAKPA